MLGGAETDVQLNCSVNRATVLDTKTIWSKENPDTGIFDQISQNLVSNPTEKYGIEGEHNLVIKNVEASDALYYLCENGAVGSRKILAFVHLIILGELNRLSRI